MASLDATKLRYAHRYHFRWTATCVCISYLFPLHVKQITLLISTCLPYSVNNRGINTLKHNWLITQICLQHFICHQQTPTYCRKFFQNHKGKSLDQKDKCLIILSIKNDEKKTHLRNKITIQLLQFVLLLTATIRARCQLSLVFILKWKGDKKTWLFDNKRWFQINCVP